MARDSRSRRNGPSYKAESDKAKRLESREFWLFRAFVAIKVVELGKWICGVLIVYFLIARPVRDLAGGDTSVSVVIRTVAELTADRWFFWFAVLFFSGGWYRERRSFQRYRKRHGQREKELEKKLDPNRKSSGLTEEGVPPKRGDQE